MRMVLFSDACYFAASEDGERQHFVHGAGAIAVAVDGSVLEAGGANGGADALEHLAVEGGVHFFGASSTRATLP